jgi:hypothetical protein
MLRLWLSILAASLMLLPTRAAEQEKAGKCVLLAKADKYLVHGVPHLEGMTPTEGHDCSLVPTTLATGEMKVLFSSFYRAERSQNRSLQMIDRQANLAGVAVDRERLYCLIVSSEEKALGPAKPPSISLVIFALDDGSRIYQEVLRPDVVVILPKERNNSGFDKGPLTLTSTGVSLFGVEYQCERRTVSRLASKKKNSK